MISEDIKDISVHHKISCPKYLFTYWILSTDGLLKCFVIIILNCIIIGMLIKTNNITIGADQNRKIIRMKALASAWVEASRPKEFLKLIFNTHKQLP